MKAMISLSQLVGDGVIEAIPNDMRGVFYSLLSLYCSFQACLPNIHKPTLRFPVRAGEKKPSDV